MTHEQLIQWGLDNNMEGFITRYRLNILELVNAKEQQTAKKISEIIIKKILRLLKNCQK